MASVAAERLEFAGSLSEGDAPATTSNNDHDEDGQDASGTEESKGKLAAILILKSRILRTVQRLCVCLTESG